jgi:hypothetical protein
MSALFFYKQRVGGSNPSTPTTEKQTVTEKFVAASFLGVHLHAGYGITKKLTNDSFLPHFF